MPTPYTFIRTDSDSADFRELVDRLNTYLAVINGDMHEFYDSHSQLATIPNVIVAYVGGKPVACGALRRMTAAVVEIKRMYVDPGARQAGLGTAVLLRLEEWAGELGYRRAVLETGTYMPDAIALYRKNGYAQIDRYPPYEAAEISVCFGKDL